MNGRASNAVLPYTRAFSIDNALLSYFDPMTSHCPNRCLMVAAGSLARVTGYSIRVWMALNGVRSVQGNSAPTPILLSFESLRDWLRPRTLRNAHVQADKVSVQLVFVPIWPKKLPGSTWINLVWAAWIIRWAVWRWKIDIVHAQSHIAAGFATRALRRDHRTKLVFDIHGVDIQEALSDGRLVEGSYAHRLRQEMQRDAVRRADWLLAVSRSLSEYLELAAEKVRVVPCVSSLPVPSQDLEDVREAARNRLNLTDRPVILYLGGASPWQQPEFLADCLSELLIRVPDALMLVITGDTARFAELFQMQNMPETSFLIQSVPHSEVAIAAAAADVGLLLREDTIVNRVASPTKFAEYLAVGVPVVLTDALADFAKIVRDESVGRVVSGSAVAADVAEVLATLLAEAPDQKLATRQRCRHAFAKHLSFNSILPAYREIYTPLTDGLTWTPFGHLPHRNG